MASRTTANGFHVEHFLIAVMALFLTAIAAGAFVVVTQISAILS